MMLRSRKTSEIGVAFRAVLLELCCRAARLLSLIAQTRLVMQLSANIDRFRHEAWLEVICVIGNDFEGKPAP